MKLLKDLIYGIRLKEVIGNTHIAIEQVTSDSRAVRKNSLFVAIRGTLTDGHKYIPQAIEQGAAAIVCEEVPAAPQEGVTYIVTNDSATAFSAASHHWFDSPSTKLKVIGITGTNGKTTVSTLLFNLLSSLEGELCGLISTIDIKIGRNSEVSTHTTPDAFTVHRNIHNMVEAGVKYCFMEVSSHALVQKRVAHVDFDVAIFTNITRDHLDYHGTMNEYIKAKKLLFDHLKEDAVAIYNDDVKHGATMVQDCRAKLRSYALNYPADYKTKIMERQFDGMLMQVNQQEVWTKLIGDFNAYNLTAVYAAAVELGKDPFQILTALSLLPPVEGRFHAVSGKGITAIVDYAHTPDALKNVLSTIEGLNEGRGRVITVVGCGGDRDKGKRPIMAQIALENSHKAVLTSDNPRSEDPNAILDDMKSALDPTLMAKSLTIVDRREAIKSAVFIAEPGDVILIAGKGHEKYQEIQGVKTPFDDIHEITLLLNS